MPCPRCGVPRHASARDAAHHGCRPLREAIAHLRSRLRLHHEAAGAREPSRAASLGCLPLLSTDLPRRAPDRFVCAVCRRAHRMQPLLGACKVWEGMAPSNCTRLTTLLILHLPGQFVDEAAAERVESTARSTSLKPQRCAPAPCALPTSTGPFWSRSTCCACCATRSRPLPRHGSGRERVV